MLDIPLRRLERAMLTRRPAKNVESKLLNYPLDGYPDRQPFYVLGFLLLRRPQGAADKQPAPESESAYFYLPEELKRLPG
jgi:hypothetical protein